MFKVGGFDSRCLYFSQGDMGNAVDILSLLPELAAIGRTQLQLYCNDWLRRPVAQEFGVSFLAVQPDLTLAVNIDPNRSQIVGEDLAFIPIDELVGYIIDQHFQNPANRNELHSELRKIRTLLRKRYEATKGRIGALYLVCKNCSAVFESDQQAAEG